MSAYMSCGLSCEIEPSNKKAPGIVEGKHFIAVIKNCSKSADELGAEVVTQLFRKALEFARAECERDGVPGQYRIAMNGPQVGTRSYLHIHIILPRGEDKLDTLVAR